MTSRDLDVVLFGATGFTGRLVAAHLSGHAPDGARVGLAGRSPDRLVDVRRTLGPRARGWPLVVADASDLASLRAMARRARVVATTVGPYAGKGLALVDACATARTDYADLTGELLFVRDSIDLAHDRAARTGARIVHACGFDSVPSDLGVLLLHQAAAADGTGDLEATTLVLRAVRGGLGGGTVATALAQLAEASRDVDRRRILADPYALSPDRAAEPDLGDEGDLRGVEHLSEPDVWAAPFVMAGFNTRVVRRSNALLGHAYGARFRYREVMAAGRGRTGAVRAVAVSGGGAVAGAAVRLGPVRALATRLLPSPGEGPDEQTRRRGFFRIEIHATTSTGARYVAHVAAEGDPGFAATAVMMGESVLCLAFDRDRLPPAAGVLTPATAMGDALVERLRAAGLTLRVERLR
ncbi:MAG TPA: saccharopine dehydrogenase NADP-binding domain-containing protein [Actinomycetes bacterium]